MPGSHDWHVERIGKTVSLKSAPRSPTPYEARDIQDRARRKLRRGYRQRHRRFAPLSGQPVSRPEIAHRRRRARRGEKHLTETPDYKDLRHHLAAGDSEPGQDRLRRPQLPGARGRDRARQHRAAGDLPPPAGIAGGAPAADRAPARVTHMDFEAEIAIVIGKPGRRISQDRMRGAHRRLQLLQRRLGARLAAPHHPVDRGQELRAHRRLRPVDGDRRRDPAGHQDDALAA